MSNCPSVSFELYCLPLNRYGSENVKYYYGGEYPNPPGKIKREFSPPFPPIKCPQRPLMTKPLEMKYYDTCTKVNTHKIMHKV